MPTLSPNAVRIEDPRSPLQKMRRQRLLHVLRANGFDIHDNHPATELRRMIEESGIDVRVPIGTPVKIERAAPVRIHQDPDLVKEMSDEISALRSELESLRTKPKGLKMSKTINELRQECVKRGVRPRRTLGVNELTKLLETQDNGENASERSE